MPGTWPEVTTNATSVSIEAQTSPLIVEDTPSDEELAAMIHEIPGAWPSHCIHLLSGQPLTSRQNQISAECGRPVRNGQYGKWQQGTRLERGIPLDVTSGTSLVIDSRGSATYSECLSARSSLTSTRSTSSGSINSSHLGTSETSMTTPPATSPFDTYYFNIETPSPTPRKSAGRSKKTQEFTDKSRVVSQKIQADLAGHYEEFPALPTTPYVYKGKPIPLHLPQAAGHSRATEAADTGVEGVMPSKSCPVSKTARKVEYWVQHVAKDSVTSLTEEDVFSKRDRIPRDSLSCVSTKDGKQPMPEGCAIDQIEICAARVNSEAAADGVAAMRGVKLQGSVFDEKKTYETSKSLKEAWRLQPKRLSW
ncbi:hypothetical protein LTR70_001300 [Exophiala xenobiotica]|uniref:Uncharacterized protein n=1 Tax=Lithohypha guttulata TaxID=1690604 RepID=A0ABR0KMJ3_9EURO|nr:hypothetical protein LTR24_000945 [Lithohypha guttulata]KAK5327979.1 hypothetical protein LTR70_001300 [Exophiala xenobiotica]